MGRSEETKVIMTTGKAAASSTSAVEGEDSLMSTDSLDIGFGVGVGSVAVVIAVIVLIVYRHKLLRKSACCAAEGSSDQRTNAGHNTEGNTGDHHYEEINVQKQQESSLQCVYANASPPADMVHYATEDFQNDGSILPVTSKNDSVPMGQSATEPPADIVHYASVDFHKDGNTLPDTNKNISTETGQSPANAPANITLYSAVIR